MQSNLKRILKDLIAFQPSPEWYSNLCNLFASVRTQIVKIHPTQHSSSESKEIPLISSFEDQPFQQLQKIANIH
jgi:hypothetical protein